MSQGVVTDYLVSLIRKQVEDHALVVWYDPEEHYREVAATLMLPKTQVVRYNGSYFKLRHEIDPLLNDLQPPRLVVYVPLDQASTRRAVSVTLGGIQELRPTFVGNPPESGR